MRYTPLLVIALVSVGCASALRMPLAAAQAGAGDPRGQSAACPPDVKGDAPTVGSGPSQDLGEKLSQSKGVICPPGAIDREMQVTPPSGGELRVVPPPGSPGGDQDVQPK